MALFFTKKARRRNAAINGPQTLGAISIGSRPFAAAVYSSILDIMLSPIANTEWRPTSPQPGWERVRDFLDSDGANIVARMVSTGYAFVGFDEHARPYLAAGEAEGVIKFASADVIRYGASTADLLRPTMDYLDAILNASHTAISRLGIVALLSPRVGEYGNALTAEEMEEEERRLADDYGALESQKIVKILRREFSAQIVNIAGADLQLTDRFVQAVRIIASKLGVPFELVPSAIVGNANTTGVYQREATLRLYQTARVWQNVLLSIAAAIGYDFEAVNPYAPQTFETDKIDFAAKMVDVLAKSVENGFISRDRAAEAVEKLLRND